MIKGYDKSKANQTSAKIGSRVLDLKSLENLLPNYNMIFDQIAGIRRNAELELENEKKFENIISEEPEFKKHHNNVFSILGGRGSGKTSVLLTLKYEMLKKQNDKDRRDQRILNIDSFIPIIVPQDMEENSDSLEWIIGFFKEKVKEINKKIEMNPFKYNNSKDNNSLCLYKNEIHKNSIQNSFDELLKAYILRQTEYKKILVNQYNGNRDYIKSNEETFNLDVQLVQKFQLFIEEYIEFKKKYYENNENSPLIYMFFDDVDISNKKCTNVLETIMRYLSHPNIVVFIAGNYDNFIETLTLQYLRNDGLLDQEKMFYDYVKADSNNQVDDKDTALQIRKDLAYDYLKKVLSPALRYDLPILNNNKKADFRYEIKHEKNSELNSDINNKNLLELLEWKFDISETTSFFRSGDQIIYSYFNVFDDRPRGLINVYYYLMDDNDWKTSEYLNQFMSIIINSNKKLLNCKDKIDSYISIKKSENNKVSIDIYYDDFERNSKDINSIEEYTIFMFLKMFENISRIDKDRIKLNLNTQNKYFVSDLFNMNLSSFRIYPKIIDEKSLIFMKDEIEIRMQNKLINIENTKSFKDLIDQIGKIYLKNRNWYLFLNDLYKDDSEWVDIIISNILKNQNNDLNIINEVFEILNNEYNLVDLKSNKMKIIKLLKSENNLSNYCNLKWKKSLYAKFLDKSISFEEFLKDDNVSMDILKNIMSVLSCNKLLKNDKKLEEIKENILKLKFNSPGLQFLIGEKENFVENNELDLVKLDNKIRENLDENLLETVNNIFDNSIGNLKNEYREDLVEWILELSIKEVDNQLSFQKIDCLSSELFLKLKLEEINMIELQNLLLLKYEDYIDLKELRSELLKYDNERYSIISRDNLTENQKIKKLIDKKQAIFNLVNNANEKHAYNLIYGDIEEILNKLILESSKNNEEKILELFSNRISEMLNETEIETKWTLNQKLADNYKIELENFMINIQFMKLEEIINFIKSKSIQIRNDLYCQLLTCIKKSFSKSQYQNNNRLIVLILKLRNELNQNLLNKQTYNKDVNNTILNEYMIDQIYGFMNNLKNIDMIECRFYEYKLFQLISAHNYKMTKEQLDIEIQEAIDRLVIDNTANKTIKFIMEYLILKDFFEDTLNEFDNNLDSLNCKKELLEYIEYNLEKTNIRTSYDFVNSGAIRVIDIIDFRKMSRMRGYNRDIDIFINQIIENDYLPLSILKMNLIKMNNDLNINLRTNKFRNVPRKLLSDLEMIISEALFKLNNLNIENSNIENDNISDEIKVEVYLELLITIKLSIALDEDVKSENDYIKDFVEIKNKIKEDLKMDNRSKFKGYLENKLELKES